MRLVKGDDGLLLVGLGIAAEVLELWRNAGAGTAVYPREMDHWLAVELAQAGPNRDAIGSWIEVRSDASEAVREVTIGGGHVSGQLGPVHFGLGDGPFRRPAGLAAGESVDLDLGGGKKVRAPVLRLVYAKENKNSYGWPLTAMVIRRPDGTEQLAEIPAQPIAQEIRWFQAYVKNCRGWLDPQKALPDLVAE